MRAPRAAAGPGLDLLLGSSWADSFQSPVRDQPSPRCAPVRAAEASCSRGPRVTGTQERPVRAFVLGADPDARAGLRAPTWPGVVHRARACASEQAQP